MKVLFPNGKTAHLEKSVADGLIAGDICVAAPDAPGTPKQPAEPGCELVFTVGTTVQTGLPKISARCHACRTESHYIIDGYERARRRNGGGVERWVVWHKGKNTVPREILAKVHALGIPEHTLSAAASMVTMQAGYQGSSRPWEYTDMDADLAKQGKTPQDRPATGFPAVYLGDINSI